jgi:hypothetical protein
MVYGEDCLDLGGSNPPLQILQPILVAFGGCGERTVHESNAFTSHPSAAAKQRFSRPKPNLTPNCRTLCLPAKRLPKSD